MNLFEVDQPQVIIECAGKKVESEVIMAYKENPNFTELVKYMDVVSGKGGPAMPGCTMAILHLALPVCKDQGRRRGDASRVLLSRGHVVQVRMKTFVKLPTKSSPSHCLSLQGFVFWAQLKGTIRPCCVWWGCHKYCPCSSEPLHGSFSGAPRAGLPAPSPQHLCGGEARVWTHCAGGYPCCVRCDEVLSQRAGGGTRRCAQR